MLLDCDIERPSKKKQETKAVGAILTIPLVRSERKKETEVFGRAETRELTGGRGQCDADEDHEDDEVEL